MSLLPDKPPTVSTPGSSLPPPPSHTLEPPIPDEVQPTENTELDYLKGLDFSVHRPGPFPCIEGLFPELEGYQKGEEEMLTAIFILIPEYKFEAVSSPTCYCSTEEIEISDYQKIHNISPNHILKVKPPKGQENKDKVFCHYNGWVRNILYILSYIIYILLFTIISSTCQLT